MTLIWQPQLFTRETTTDALVAFNDFHNKLGVKNGNCPQMGPTLDHYGKSRKSSDGNNKRWVSDCCGNLFN